MILTLAEAMLELVNCMTMWRSVYGTVLVLFSLLQEYTILSLVHSNVEHKTQLGAEQGQLPWLIGTSSGNCQEMDTCMV